MILTKIQKNQLQTTFLSVLQQYNPTFRSKKDPLAILECIIHKLKTGCQWRYLFVDIEGVKPPFSWELVYYYFARWQRIGLIEALFEEARKLLVDQLDMSRLYLDGTHTMAKRGGSSVGYQGRKKSKTTNHLVLCDGNGLPLAISEPIAGNHNDLFEAKVHVKTILKNVKKCKQWSKETVMTADAGFDSKPLRALLRQHSLKVNIRENTRNRKQKKRGRKRYFSEEIYQTRYVNERVFAWLDSFRSLLVRHEKHAVRHRALWLLAMAIILFKRL
jgi:transposase